MVVQGMEEVESKLLSILRYRVQSRWGRSAVTDAVSQVRHIGSLRLLPREAGVEEGNISACQAQ
jgi:hypothetical protein